MSQTKTRVIRASCPDCGEGIQLQGLARIGQKVICPNCDAELEVIETDPVELDWVYDDDSDEDEDEDW